MIDNCDNYILFAVVLPLKPSSNTRQSRALFGFSCTSIISFPVLSVILLLFINLAGHQNLVVPFMPFSLTQALHIVKAADHTLV